ncbi:MAG: FAD-dependent oxidoreductase [Chloroflexi bacterium]|jgi:thioredoxin reductase (NADPH)|nr:FAD-dependent oxidoreductase [Chloroflexota bacterium]
MPTPNITVYGAYWCPDCRRSKQFLGEHQIPYNWVDIEQDKAGEAYVLQKNDGKRIIPTIEFEDNSILVEPSNAALAQKLGLKTTANRSHYDLIVIGGGPAGLTTALYTAREGIETLVIERAALGGQAATTQWLDNVPGFSEGISGADFSKQLRLQAERFGVELLQAQDVTRIHSHDNYHCVFTDDGSEYSAKALVVATGSRYKHLNVPGEDEYIGAGIHFCATCDGPFYKGLPVAVIGGGNSATEESLFLTKFVERVTLLVRGGELNASQVLQEKVLSHPQIDIRFHTDVVEFRGAESKLNTVIIQDRQTQKNDEIHPAGVFTFIGQNPNTGFLAGSGVDTNPWGFITTGHTLIHDGTRPAGFEARDPALLETSTPGIFAAGDVRADSTKQVASAAGEGATAALLVREYLKTV